MITADGAGVYHHRVMVETVNWVVPVAMVHQAAVDE